MHDVLYDLSEKTIQHIISEKLVPITSPPDLQPLDPIGKSPDEDYLESYFSCL